ncbi:extracellular calcium-sensing receptor-like [Pleurodeles waltl]|uniref:extracellular calcium-sensing receptor-like n=1 Tax=Pleurodeles waltl TaxID=8319 RepID=UPI003709B9E4
MVASKREPEAVLAIKKAVLRVKLLRTVVELLERSTHEAGAERKELISAHWGGAFIQQQCHHGDHDANDARGVDRRHLAVRRGTAGRKISGSSQMSQGNSKLLSEFVYDYYLWLQAMVFAVENINRNSGLLANITLGFHIYNSCRMLRPVLEGTLWILTGRAQPVLNYQCWGERQPAAIIGDSLSSRSILMARILGLYRYPQISYSASNPILSDRIQFPSFFRTVPSDDYQSHGLAQLVMHFRWAWVGLLAEDSDYGQQGIRLLQGELIKAGACIAFSENIISNKADKNALHITQVIKNSTANAIVVFSFDPDLAVVLDELLKQNVTGKIWVASEAWSTSTILSTEKYSEILSGTIGFATFRGEMPDFKKYLTSVQPLRSSGFIREFWEDAFGCKWLDYNTTLINSGYSSGQCTGDENLESLEMYQNDVTSFTVSYNIYRSVYAIALALHDLSSCAPGRGPFHHGSCADITDYQPWQLLHYIKNIHLQGSTRTFFDRYGNPPARYDVVNWQRSRQGTFKQVKVGEYDSSAPSGTTLIINNSAILWAAGSKEVPTSVCSSSCLSGFRKASKEGEPICCFQCIPCSQGEISNHTDSIECFTCSWDQWPNENQDLCLPKTTEFLSYEEPLGAVLATISVFFSSIPVAILGIFICHRDTAIVKANNRSLSYLLLLSLTLCFLCSLTFIGYPTAGKCLVRQAAFGINFSLCVSCILAKTIMVVIAFKATKPNSNLRRWVGLQLSYTIISVCTLLQFILCIFWLSLSPPFSMYNIHSQPGKIIFECNEGSPFAFWIMLGYLGLLATISFIVAFLSRKLPDSFNEAKFITFSMLAFLSVWLSFIPAYLSTKGKYMVAMEIFAILSSSFGLLFCIFFPKCYIILLKPEMNTKEHLIGRGAGHRSSYDNICELPHYIKIPLKGIYNTYAHCVA